MQAKRSVRQSKTNTSITKRLADLAAQAREQHARGDISDAQLEEGLDYIEKVKSAIESGDPLRLKELEP